MSQEECWAWTLAVDTCMLLAEPVFSLRLCPLPRGLPVSWAGVSVPFPGWPSQVVGGGGGYGQLAESRPWACQAAYSNSGPQGPAGLQARAGGGRWKQQNRPWTGRLAVQLLTWEVCPTSPGRQGLNTLPRAPIAPPTATGKLPGTTALCAWLGWVSAPFSGWGQHTLPRARESLCPWGRPWLGASLPALAICPPPPLLPGLLALALPWPPSSQPQLSPWEQGLCVCTSLLPFRLISETRGQSDTASVSTATPSHTSVLYFLSLSCPPHIGCEVVA